MYISYEHDFVSGTLQKLLKKHDGKLEPYWACLAESLDAVRRLRDSACLLLWICLHRLE